MPDILEEWLNSEDKVYGIMWGGTYYFSKSKEELEDILRQLNEDDDE